MSRFRLRVGFCLAVFATSLMVLWGLRFTPTAAAAQPQVNAQAVARVMQVQNRHTGPLMAIPGVVGTATGLNAAGQPVVKVFLERRGIGGIPANLEGVPVAAEVTGRFYALQWPPGRTLKRRPDPFRRPGRDRPPSVTITYPGDGDTVSGSVTVTANATDDKGVTKVQFLADGSSISTDTNGGNGWSATWESTSVSNGSHTLQAIATDTIGQTGSDSITVTVDNGGEPVHPPLWCTRPVPIGVSTGHPNITAGTIGCRVKDAKGNVYALSNNHIYADCNRAKIGDNVLQPGPYDGGVNPDDAIGTLSAFQPIVFSRRANNTIDAAIALSSTGLLGNATPSDGYGTPSSTITAPAGVGLHVMKYGRTTGLTHGQVYAINTTVTVTYDVGVVARFVGQIVVTPGTFSAGGDSGSLVVTDNEGKNPVGLLFAGSTSYTICNPIDAVLTGLGVAVDGQ
jgi:hypothetical protein